MVGYLQELPQDALYALYTISPDLYKRVAAVGFPVLKRVRYRADGEAVLSDEVEGKSEGWDIPGRSPVAGLRQDLKRSSCDMSPGYVGC